MTTFFPALASLPSGRPCKQARHSQAGEVRGVQQKLAVGAALQASKAQPGR